MDIILSFASFFLDLALIIIISAITLISLLFITEFFLDRKNRRSRNKKKVFPLE